MERFSVVYRITGNEQEAYEKAKDICLEQTVEFPAGLVPPGFIQDEVVGQIIEFISDSATSYKATISYSVGTAAGELTQLLNVVFGNISIKPGFRVEEIILPESLTRVFNGPRFGIQGLRQLLHIPERPLLATALKPMGLSSGKLAELAYQCAIGGIDIIKDDHGLTNQSFAPFKERVRLCSQAVDRAGEETGRKSIYVANITGPQEEILSRASYAKACGAGGLLLAPGLAGFDTMRRLADDNNINLPIFSHPAFLGSYVVSPNNGISHYTLFGQLMRLAGADSTIYPNYGGRFSFSREESSSIIRGTGAKMGEIKPIFPCPGGGMSMENIPDMMQVYGPDTIFLIGGGLFKKGPDLVANCQYFHSLIENSVK